MARTTTSTTKTWTWLAGTLKHCTSRRVSSRAVCVDAVLLLGYVVSLTVHLSLCTLHGVSQGRGRETGDGEGVFRRPDLLKLGVDRAGLNLVCAWSCFSGSAGAADDDAE